MMSEHDHLDNSLKDLGTALRERPSLKDRIIDRLAAPEESPRMSDRPWYGSRFAKAITVLAACLVVALGVWKITGEESASQAFAAAIESVRQASTFSCKRIYTNAASGEVREELIMFKEPNFERREVIKCGSFQFNGEVTIRDYGSRKELRLMPSEKTAGLSDKSSDYEIDESTGKVKLRELDTSVRGQLVQWSEEEDVEDLGRVELEGRTVRLLKSRWGVWEVKVWADPQSRMPVQVILRARDGEVSTYTSIKIDEELSDEHFSLEPPEGYRLKEFKGWPDEKAKLNAKMSFLAIACYRYADKHDGQFPEKLDDLIEAGIKEEVLKTILAASGQPDGPIVIRYRHPPKNGEGQTCVLMYEAYETWPEPGLVVCFLDGHREIIVDQKRFEELLQKGPAE